MKEWINRVERIVIRLLALSLLLMVLVQGVMTVDPLRFYLSWGERMEGQKIEFPVQAGDQNRQLGTVDEVINDPGEALLVLSIKDYTALPRTRVLVNNKEKGSFDKQEIQLLVRAGDRVEIDSSFYKHPVEYKVISVSSNLAYPEKGAVYSANGTVVMLGEIIVK